MITVTGGVSKPGLRQFFLIPKDVLKSLNIYLIILAILLLTGSSMVFAEDNMTPIVFTTNYSAKHNDTSVELIKVEDLSDPMYPEQYFLTISETNGYKIICPAGAIQRGLGYWDPEGVQTLDSEHEIVKSAKADEQPELLCEGVPGYEGEKPILFVIRSQTGDQYYLWYMEKGNNLYSPGCQGLIDALGVGIDEAIEINKPEDILIVPEAGTVNDLIFNINCNCGEPISISLEGIYQEGMEDGRRAFETDPGCEYDLEPLTQNKYPADPEANSRYNAGYIQGFINARQDYIVSTYSCNQEYIQEFIEEGRMAFRGESPICPDLPTPKETIYQFPYDGAETLYNESYKLGFNQAKREFESTEECLEGIEIVARDDAESIFREIEKKIDQEIEKSCLRPIEPPELPHKYPAKPNWNTRYIDTFNEEFEQLAISWKQANCIETTVEQGKSNGIQDYQVDDTCYECSSVDAASQNKNGIAHKDVERLQRKRLAESSPVSAEKDLNEIDNEKDLNEIDKMWGPIASISSEIYTLSETSPRMLDPRNGGIFIYSIKTDFEKEIFINLFRLTQFIKKAQDLDLPDSSYDVSRSLDELDTTLDTINTLNEKVNIARFHLYLSYWVKFKTAVTLHKKCVHYQNAINQREFIFKFLEQFKKDTDQGLTIDNIDFERFALMAQTQNYTLIEKLFSEDYMVDSLACKLRPIQTKTMAADEIRKTTAIELPKAVTENVTEMLEGIDGAVLEIAEHRDRLEALDIVDIVKRTMQLEDNANNLNINFRMIKKDNLLLDKKFQELKTAANQTPEAPSSLHPDIVTLDTRLFSNEHIQGGLSTIFDYFQCGEDEFDYETYMKSETASLGENLAVFNQCVEKRFSSEQEANFSYATAIRALAKQLENWSKKYE